MATWRVVSILWVFVSCTRTAFQTGACGNCTCHNGTLANCSGLSFISVPRHLPRNITILLLSHNNITLVPNRAFQAFHRLKVLDLSNNGEMSFDEDAFHGLLKLKSLMLDHRRGVFERFNSTIQDYPDKSLSKLVSLTTLRINGIQNYFGQGFLSLKNLRNLSLSFGDCNMVRLRNTTFINVPLIEHLNISHCSIDEMEPLTFKPLKNIHSIDVSYNRNLGFRNFSKAVYGLANSSIRSLKINKIYPEYGACSRLLIEDLFYLKHTNLTHLYLDGNGITEINTGVMSNLPHTLEYFSGRENRFAFGSYLLEVTQMPSVEFIDVSLMNVWHKFPLHWAPYNETQLSIIKMHLPPKLKTIVLEKCHITGVLSKTIFEKNSLRNVIANHNLLSTTYGPIFGLDKMEHWDLSHNQLQTLCHNFFPVNNSVTYLNLGHNFLGKQLESDISGNTFGRLLNAKLVDISSNIVDQLPGAIFKGLNAVETLNLSGNFLELFEAGLEHLLQLQMLDLSNNKLKRLSIKTLTEMEKIREVKINLRGNPLFCSCQDIYFLNWINKNRHRFNDLNQMTCELPDQTFADMNRTVNILDTLQSQCRTARDIQSVTITASCCVFIICFVVVSIAYRHRWKIRYLYYIARRRYWHSRVNARADCMDQYQYDLFVSYAETDRQIVIQEMISELEDRAGLRICIHHRDFLPGEAIASNIVNAIDRSKKTLIILSPSFLKSDWCVYEFEIALQTRVSRRQNNLLILLYQHVPVQDLPRDMAVLLSTNCYLEYNPEVYGREAFWQNLVEAFKMVQPLE